METIEILPANSRENTGCVLTRAVKGTGKIADIASIRAEAPADRTPARLLRPIETAGPGAQPSKEPIFAREKINSAELLQRIQGKVPESIVSAIAANQKSLVRIRLSEKEMEVAWELVKTDCDLSSLSERIALRIDELGNLTSAEYLNPETKAVIPAFLSDCTYTQTVTGAPTGFVTVFTPRRPPARFARSSS